MPRSSQRSLWPREHGAYAQLAMPLVAALLVRAPTLPAGLLAAAAVGAFLANEPLLVLLGHRGARMRECAGARARVRLGSLVGVALGTGVCGLGLASHATLVVAAIAAVPALVLIGLACRRGQHSLVGELVAAFALPAAAAPVAVASGLAPSAALLLWGAWGVGYATSVEAVHRVIARHRRPAGRIDRMFAGVLGAATLAASVLATSLPVVVVGLPLLVVSTALVIHPPSARRLRAVGVAFVIASLTSIGFAIAVV